MGKSKKNRTTRDFSGGHGIKALGKRDGESRFQPTVKVDMTGGPFEPPLEEQEEDAQVLMAQAFSEITKVVTKDRVYAVRKFLRDHRGPGVVTLGTVKVLGDCLTFGEAWRHLYPGTRVPNRRSF